jgi:hypothetical protein
METPAINNTIAFLMASNNEDIAADLANEVVALKLELERLRQEIMDRRERHQIKSIELERVKKIARDRLATIASLRSCQGSLDECEDSLSPAGNDGLYGAYLRGELD